MKGNTVLAQIPKAKDRTGAAAVGAHTLSAPKVWDLTGAGPSFLACPTQRLARATQILAAGTLLCWRLITEIESVSIQLQSVVRDVMRRNS